MLLKNLLMSLKLDKISKSNIVVSIIGPSNSGKSTLLNKVLDEKVSIVSRKVQTTRMGLRGILNNNETQIIFIDTPGLFEAKTIFEKAMVENAFSNLNDADLIYFLIDGSRKLSNFDKKVLKYFKNFKKEAFLIINKIDLIEKKQLLEITNIINSYFAFNLSNIIPPSLIFCASPCNENKLKKSAKKVGGHLKNSLKPDI